MNNCLIEQEEGKLLNVIESLGDLEWRRFQQRFPQEFKEGKLQRADRSGYPPVCSFRFVNEDIRVIERLIQAIKDYRGQFEWVMIGRQRENLPGRNWMVCAKRFWEIENFKEPRYSAGRYMAEHEPEFGPKAYDDFKNLTDYLQEKLL